MSNMYSSGWDDDRVEKLTHMWTVKGMSASQIAKALGAGFSRNSVIGKLHRMGLSGHGKASPPMSALLKPAKPKPVKTSPGVERAFPRPKPKAGDPDVIVVGRIIGKQNRPVAVRIDAPVEPPPGSLARPWLTRVFGECAWPMNTWGLGEGDTAVSCCAPVEGAGPYCAHHHTMSVQPVQPKRPPVEHNAPRRRAA